MSASLDGRMLRVSVGAVAAVFALNFTKDSRCLERQ